MNQALHKVLAMPDVKQRMLGLGVEARASTPEELHSPAPGRYREMGRGDRQGRDRAATEVRDPLAANRRVVMKGVVIRDFERPPQGALDELTELGVATVHEAMGGPGS